LDPSEEHPMNLRLNYSKTVARPGIREISDIAVVDYELRAPVFGNSDLKPVRINNYDIRWESYRASGTNITLSVFHKDFRNHIELVNANGYTWQNVDKSNVSGMELEFKFKPLKNFEFSSNITLAKSTTTFVRSRFELANGIKVFIPIDTLTRSTYGQSPYVFNAMVSYKRDSLGLTLTAAYNLQGPRLVISSNVKEIPDVYELPRHLIDLKASKKLGSHFTASLTVKDLLNTPVRRAYNYDDGFDVLDYDRYGYGTTYIFTLAYKL
jgi:outer membrane receptor protein involved in Fe transport